MDWDWAGMVVGLVFTLTLRPLPRIKSGAGFEGEGAVDWYSRYLHTYTYPCEP